MNDASKMDSHQPGGKEKGGSVVALMLTLLFSVFAVLAVFKAPIGFLWKPAVGSTEFGHILALLALLPLLGGMRGLLGKTTVLLTVLNVLLLVSPLIRGVIYAQDVATRVEAAFGAQTPSTRPGAPSRAASLSMASLVSIPSPEVTAVQHKYKAADGSELIFDLYQMAPVEKPQPLIIQIHGGSWRSGDQTQLPPINRYLAARGFTVAAITYRLAPTHPYPAAYKDVLAAIEHFRDNDDKYKIDDDKIVLMGRSAGGHLALLAGYREPKHIKGIIAFYPPTDLEWSWNHPSNPLVLNSPETLGGFMGGTFEEKSELYREASPIHYVEKDSPPTVLIHGGRDELVSPKQSRRLAKVLEEKGVSHFHLDLPWATHGCEANLAGPSGQLSLYVIERFLAKVAPAHKPEASE